MTSAQMLITATHIAEEHTKGAGAGLFRRYQAQAPSHGIGHAGCCVA